MRTRRQTRGNQIDVDWRDPHLYHGVPVEIADNNLPANVNRRVLARFVKELPYELCLVVLYPNNKPTPRIVPIYAVMISQRNEPPPLPGWARGAH